MSRLSVEKLEARQLLSGSIERAMAGGEPRSLEAATFVAPLDPSSAMEMAAVAAAAQIDAAAVREELIRFVDTWNGGQAGRLGTSGMGTYAATWDGLFRMNLNRQFDKINYYTNDQTIISQSRAIYINVEAYRAAPAADRARFKTAVQKSADYLIAKAVDPANYNGKPGGMWWGLQPDGVSPPTHTTPIFGTAPRHKDAYGQVQSLFSLAHAYSITADADHLSGAFAQLDVWNSQFADTAAGPGAFLPTANEDYSQRVDTRNLDYMTHAFEALLTLNEVTPASHPRKAELAAQINNIGNFITTHMYRDAAGSTTMGYLPWYYDASWNPSADPNQQYVTPGHNMEVAFLLSRAVERGFSATWLPVANKLVAFALQFGFDNAPASPTYGAVLQEKVKFDGQPFTTTAPDLVWWQSSEAARTLLNFAVVRGRNDLWDEYDAAISFIHNHFVDPVYGGWFTSLNPTTLAPTTTNKGTVWTGGYHEAMLYAEQLRLAKPQTPTPFSGTPIAIPTNGSATIQAENFDNGGEAIAYHDTDTLNSGYAYRTTTGVDIQPTTDGGGGYNLGWTRAGEWLVYSVNVASGGNYDFDFRVASPAAGGKFHLEVDGVNVTGALTVPNTGGWQTWQNVKKADVALTAGPHLLRLAMDAASPSGVANFNYFSAARSAAAQPTPFTGTPIDIPSAGSAMIEAERFDNGGEGVAYHDTDAVNSGNAYRTIGVDIQSTTDAGGGYNVGWTRAGEWLVYSVSVETGGSYDFTFRVASPAAGGKFHLDVDGIDLTGALVLPNTGGWQAWQDVKRTGVALTAGTHLLRLSMDVASNSGVGNFNYFKVVRSGTGTTTTIRNETAAFVRDGSYASTNYGANPTLEVKKSTTGYTREAYLKFDLSSVASIGTAKLRLFGSLIDAAISSMTLGLYAAASTWTEPALTWSTRPAAGSAQLAGFNVSGTTAKWYEIDLSSYLKSEKAAGRNLVTLVLRSQTASATVCAFTSDEGANGPELQIVM